MQSTAPASKEELHVDFEPIDIDFINQLQGFNLPSYTSYVNIYNGAGVAVGDINNDGLQDLFFSGSAVQNKLFLNKGNFEFEDISKSANIQTARKWSNGAVFTDINNDGWEDIYISQALSRDPKGRENQLFINNGDNTFSEQAEAYGVNDSGYSIQSVFFDYDNDGDNDLFVGNHPLKRRVGQKTHYNLWKNPILKWSDKLYENIDGKFIDVTKKSGILNYGWTLSFITSDFNEDGFMDIYVAVDHGEPDRLYINNQDGTFTDRISDYFDHFSLSSMGSDIADINNDGLIDLFTTEMLASNNYREKTQMASMNPDLFYSRLKNGYGSQFMRNMMQLKVDNETFVEIGQHLNINRSDWSWSTLFCDFDNDADDDLFIANGYYKDLLDKDFRKELTEIRKEVSLPVDQKKTALLQKERTAKSTPVKNQFHINKSNLQFENITDAISNSPATFSSGAAYVDLNNDGLMDIVSNNIDRKASIYKNTSNLANRNYIKIKLSHYLNNDPTGAIISVIVDDKMLATKQYLRTRGYASGVSNITHVGLGFDTDHKNLRIKVKWPNQVIKIYDGISINQLNILDYKAGKSVEEGAKIEPIFQQSALDQFVHLENEFDDFEKQVLLPHKMSTQGPCLAQGDINNDGHLDVFVGSSVGQVPYFMLSDGQGQLSKWEPKSFQQDRLLEDGDAVIFDANNDGLSDIYITSNGNEYEEGSIHYKHRLYLGNDQGELTLAENQNPLLIPSSCVSVADLNKDGWQDLLVLGRHRPHHYPLSPSSAILINQQGNGFVNATETLCGEFKNVGMLTDGAVADLNGDGRVDIVTVGEWESINIFTQLADGSFINTTSNYFEKDFTGWWNCIKIDDIDNDGDLDLVAGNLGTNYKYKATDDKPFHIYGNDFDNSGSTDIVLGYYFDNDSTLYPVRGKQCSSQQIPELLDKYKSYNEFASSSLIDIYGEDKIETSFRREVNEFKSGIFINENGKFSFRPFDNFAQLAPINDLVLLDIDNDGYKDIIAGGNLYEAEVETGSADAGRGLLIKNKSGSAFESLPIEESGINVKGNIKNLISLADQNLLLFARNNESLISLRLNQKQI